MEFNSARIGIEKALELFGEELKHYHNKKRLPGGVVVHLAPVGNTGYFIGTLTCYNEEGLKSENALPFQKFIRIANEIEDLIAPYQTNGFTGRLVGWNPTPKVRDFLYKKKTHRLFFLEEHHVLPFVKSFTSDVRTAARKEHGIDVVVMVG